MSIDITQLTLDEKRELALRYASRLSEAIVPMDEPALSTRLVEYLRWDDNEQRATDILAKAFGGKLRDLQ